MQNAMQDRPLGRTRVASSGIELWTATFSAILCTYFLTLYRPQEVDDVVLDELMEGGRLALTVGETAKLLGIDPRTIRRAIEAGDIPAISIGRRILIPVKALTALLTEGNFKP